jgi:hypothetical protein
MRPALLTPTQYMMINRVGLPIDGIWPKGAKQSEIYAGYYWELEHICLFQQNSHTAVQLRNERLDVIAAENSEMDLMVNAQATMDDEEREGRMLAQIRRRDHVLAEERLLETIEAFNAELVTIAIWTVIEKNLFQMLNAIEIGAGKAPSKNARFDAMTKGFLSFNVNVETLDGFFDIDECRSVNNAIKHGGTIGSGLESFRSFAGLSGEPIRTQTLDLQRYLFGAYTFLGKVLPSVP